MARGVARRLFRRRPEQSAVQGLGNRPGNPGYRGYQRPCNERLPGVDRSAESTFPTDRPQPSMARAGRRAAVDLVVQCPLCRNHDPSSVRSHCRSACGIRGGLRVPLQIGK